MEERTQVYNTASAPYFKCNRETEDSSQQPYRGYHAGEQQLYGQEQAAYGQQHGQQSGQQYMQHYEQHYGQQYEQRHGDYAAQDTRYTGYMTSVSTRKSMQHGDDMSKDPVIEIGKPRVHRPAHFYIPTILRLPNLCVVFLISAILIGVVQVGLQKLPHASKSTSRMAKHGITSRAIASSSPPIWRRAPQTTSISSSALAPNSASSSSPTTPPSTTSLFSSVIESSSATPGPITVGAASPDQYVAISVTVDSQKTSQPTKVSVARTPTSNYVQLTLSQAASDYVQVTVPASSAPLRSTMTSLDVTPGLTLDQQIASSTVGSAYVASKLSATVQTLVPLTIVTSMISDVVTSGVDGQTRTIQTLLVYTSTASRTIQTVVPLGSSTAEATASPDEKDPRRNVATFPLWIVFVGNGYFALVSAVVFKQFWTAIYFQAKVIQPFAMLNSPDGAKAETSMNIFYLSTRIVPEPILALLQRNWFILWTGLTYLAVGLLGPLGSEALFLDTHYTDCPLPTTNVNNPCWPPRLSIDPVIAQGLQALLAFIAVMTLNIMWMVSRIRTGVYSDPSSIAAVAALTHHPDVLDDFRALSVEATAKDLSTMLSTKRYKLGEYRRPDGVWRYGFVPAFLSNPDHPARPETAGNVRPADTHIQGKRVRTWKSLDTLLNVLFFLVLLALLGLVAGYYKDSRDTAFNRFFNSQAFGARFVLTGTGTLIAVNWKRLERDAHTLSPFARMAKSPACPIDTILLRKSSIPLTSIIPMLLHRYLFAGLVALVALLSDVLIIFLGAVPFTAGQVYMELLVSSFTCFSLLAIMTLVMLALIIWKRSLPDLPRMPDTVGALISYLADAKMLDDFDGAEWWDNAELKGRIAGLGKRYIYGRSIGSDGATRYLVDGEDTSVYQA